VADVTRLLGRRWLSHDTFQLDLERPDGFHFQPGQGIRLRRGDLEREYSLTSSPEEDALSICVRMVDGGKFSPRLAEAEIGSELAFSGPHGFFVFRPSGHPAVFIATGTGIAPFVSMVRAGVSDFVMAHGAPAEADLHFQSIVAPAARSYTGCTSREKPARTGASRRAGRVTDYVMSELPGGVYDFYLCGRRDMVRDVTGLVDERFSGSAVYSEIFH
jgi:ferredoxin-NADP reductase